MADRFGAGIQGAMPGLSRLAMALGGGQDAEQQSFLNTMGAQSKIAQALAAAREADAKAAGQARVNELQDPGAMLHRAMLASGVPMDAAPDVQQFLNTGRIDKYEMAPGQAGPVLPAPEYAKPAALTKLGQRLAADLAVVGGASKDQADYYGGQQKQFETGLEQGLVDGTVPATRVR